MPSPAFDVTNPKNNEAMPSTGDAQSPLAVALAVVGIVVCMAAYRLSRARVVVKGR